jgi:hypothetical protein
VRRSFAAWSACLLLACCAGCGGSHDVPHEASAPPASAADRTAVRSAVAATRNTTERITDTIVVADAAHTFTITITGSFDMAHDKGRLTLEFPGGAVDRMDEVFAGGKVYLRGIAGVGDGWAETDRDAALTHYMLRAPLNDPEYVLEQIAAMDHVSRGTPAKIGGITAAHYAGTLGFAALTLRMAPDTRQQMAGIRDVLGTVVADADVWVDPAGRVARTRTFYTFQKTSVTATLTLSDAGVPVTVTPPNAAVTVPAAGISGVLPG